MSTLTTTDMPGESRSASPWFGSIAIRTGTRWAILTKLPVAFSGRITLPTIQNIPGINQLVSALNNLNFHSSAPRCNGASAPNDPNPGGNP